MHAFVHETRRDMLRRGRRRETPAMPSEAFHLVSETGRNVGDGGRRASYGS